MTCMEHNDIIWQLTTFTNYLYGIPVWFVIAVAVVKFYEKVDVTPRVLLGCLVFALMNPIWYLLIITMVIMVPFIWISCTYGDRIQEIGDKKLF